MLNPKICVIFVYFNKSKPENLPIKKIISSKVIIGLLFWVGGIFSVNTTLAQRSSSFPDEPATFLAELQNRLENSNQDVLVALASDVGRIWKADLGLDLQTKLIAHFKIMSEKGYKLNGRLSEYLETLVMAIDQEGLNQTKLLSYMNMTEEVIKSFESRYLMTYFNSMRNFFEFRALYYSNFSNLIVTNDEYTFEYVGSVTILDLEIEEEAEIQKKEVNTATGAFESWDSEPAEEEWGSEWGNEWGDEKSGEEEPVQTLEDVLIQDAVQPPVSGPTIVFSKLDLVFTTQIDSALTLSKTAGSFTIKDGMFIGEGGKFDWSRTGLGADTVFVTLSKYNFDTKRPVIEAENVTLTYSGKVAEPIEGIFSFNGLVTNKTSYPRFISYRNNIPVVGIGNEDLSYTGGFSLNGKRIVSSSIFEGLSKIEVTKNGVKKFKARSRLFELGDSLITAERAAIVIYHERDSITHPTVRVSYNTKTDDLILQKDKGGFKRTPYSASFFNTDFIADIVRWEVNSDSLEISILNARDEIPAVFESKEYYNPDQVTGSIALYKFNPLSMVMGYYNKKGSPIYLESLEKFTGLERNTIKSSLFYLMWAGFIDYNINTQEVTIKEKALHTTDAQKSKKDFDNIRMLSLTNTNSNATFDMANEQIVVRGIEKFYISEILDVYIQPDSSTITLLENRTFKFDGKVFAGNFEYIGRDFTFNYDAFTLELNQIDSIEFYVLEEDSRGSRRRKVDNAISGITPEDSIASEDGSTMAATSGTLFINRANNKSGRKIFSDYPKFDGTGSSSIVYFNRPEYLGGVYNRSVYFLVPPFKLDSLSNSDPSSIGFTGTFGSSGMFPDFKESLKIQPDFSLGFEHSLPPSGYPLYNTTARFFNKMKLDKAGIRGNGEIKYLTTDLISNDFIFYVDSVTTEGSVAEVRKETHLGTSFPKLYVENYKLRWLPRKDSMYITNLKAPIQIYDNTATLDGTANITKGGIKGSGTLLTRGSQSVSSRYAFNQNNFSARQADFEVKSSNPEKPVLKADGVKLNFDLTQNFAEITPEVAGDDVLEFPFAQFKTSIPSAVWDLDSSIVKMAKPAQFQLEDSYFYTTRKDLDSLAFYATEAVYDIKKLELKVSGIPFITVADAKITPEGGEVLILENAQIGTLKNTTLVIDTLNEYHRLYDGTITIISRKKFEGEATYQFVNASEDTFAIKLTNFRLEDLSANKRRQEFHTVANGGISQDDNLLISPGMYYKGDVKMIANSPALELDGYVKLDLKKISGYDTWIRYQSAAEQQEVIFDFDNSVTENGLNVSAGLHFDVNDFSLYSTFVTDKRNYDDEDFFRPGGNLKYLQDSAQFIIISPQKESGETLAGKSFTFNEETGDISFDGTLQFLENDKSRSITAAGVGTGNLETNEFDFNAFMSIIFNIPQSAFDLMAVDLKNSINLYGAPEALGDKTTLLYKIANLFGDKVAKTYEEQSAMVYIPLVSISPAVVKPIVLSNVDLKWSDINKAFYSVGGIGVSNILREDINGSFEGFLEIIKRLDGERIDLFLKASVDSWYYFSYENNKLITYSSNPAYNEFIATKSNAGKSKIGEFVFIPGDESEILTFVNRFRNDYLNIQQPYQLNAAPIEEDLTDDGFGGKKKKDGNR